MTEETQIFKQLKIIVKSVRYEGKHYPLDECVLYAFIKDENSAPSETSTFKSFVKVGDRFVIEPGQVVKRKIGVSFRIYQANGKTSFSMSDDRNLNECPKTVVYVETIEDTVELTI